MKVECGSCAARYAIADEKIAGRVFKIRCKRCQSAIVVRGDRVEATTDDTVSAQVVWHVVVDGTQDGPFDAETLGAMRAAGTIDGEAFVWREGWADWRPMSAVDELAPLDAPEDDPAGEGADLFARPDASPFAGDDDVVSSTPSARPSANSSGGLTGSRNESSVLFSLSNLSALSTGPSREAESKAVTLSGPSRATGKAGPTRVDGSTHLDGSGLIDIRALAASGMAGGLGSAPGPITPAADEGIDALLSIGGGSPLSPLAAPVLAPAKEDADRRPVLLAGFGVAGLAVVAVAAVAVVFLTRPSAPETPALPLPAIAMPENPVTDPPEPPNGPALVARPGAPRPSETATPPDPAVPDTAVPDTAVPDTAVPETSARETSATAAIPERAHAPRRARTHGPAAEPARPETARAAARPNEQGERTLNQLVESALDPERAPRREPTGPAADLPATPGRGDVVAAMNRLSGPVRACGDGAHGNATVSFAFGSDGAVRSADVTAADLPPAVRSCVAQAARTARVSPFTQGTFRVVFPFRV
jgi:predicted Zn finger-like uncharacterized protein